MRPTVSNRAISRSVLTAACVALALAVACLLTACSFGEKGEIATIPESYSQSDQESTSSSAASESTQAADDEATPANDEAASIVASMTLEQKVAQMFIVKPEDITGVDAVIQAGEQTRAALQQYPVGGIIYFGTNLQNADQTRAMLTATQEFSHEITGLPAFLCVDEEGGTVSRIGGTEGFGVANVGNMSEVGATGDTAQAKTIATTIGTYLTELGFNVDFAPDADVANNPNSDTMALRSFGTTGAAVAPFVTAQVEGFTEAGILSCAKHFPGIGGAEGDSHEVSIYSHKTLDEMEQDELLPFEAAIEADVPFVMVGHLSTPEATGDDTPASVNPAIVTDVLREQLGYDGIVITDSMSMGAIVERYTAGDATVRAIEAGVDIVLTPADFPTAYQSVLDAVHSGRITEERIDESVTRIVRAKTELA